jgi:hypothetical protein
MLAAEYRSVSVAAVVKPTSAFINRCPFIPITKTEYSINVCLQFVCDQCIRRHSRHGNFFL